MTSQKLEYKHNSAMEFQTFAARLRTMARTKSADCFKAYSGDTNDNDTGNVELFDLIINNTINDTLVQTLSNNYLDKGFESLQYIGSSWTTGASTAKAKSAAQEYTQLLTKPFGNDFTMEQFRAHANEMDNKRAQLKNTSREITDAAHCLNIWDMTCNIDTTIEHEMRMAELKLEKHQMSDVGCVLSTCEDAIAYFINKRGSKKTFNITQPSNDMLQKFTAQYSRTDRQLETCDLCGIAHPFAGRKDKCHAVIRAQGGTPPGWDSKPEEMRKKVDARAADYKRLGPWSKRAHSSKPEPDMKALLVNLLSSMSTSDINDLKAMCTSLNDSNQSARRTMLVDSGNLNKTGDSFHLIKDFDLFTEICTSEEAGCESFPIETGNGTTYSKGKGACCMITKEGHSIKLHKCLYVPTLPDNLLSVKAAKEQGVNIRFEDFNNITFPDGTIIEFSPDTYSLEVLPMPYLAANPAVIRRGKHGPTHFKSPPMSTNDEKELKIWSARLNDPPVSVLKSMHKYMDNTPNIFKKATESNTISDAKLLATGKQMPTRPTTEPIAKSPGDITAVDYWSAGLRSGLTQHCGMFSFIDVKTGYFKFYPVASKDEARAVTQKYMLEAKHEGIDVLHGSVLYSDNEHIFTSKQMAELTSNHGLLQKFSNEYEPWGNGCAESVFRYAPDSMRKMHVRSGVPEDFFTYSAWATQDILNATRTRDGTSCYELWHKKAPDATHFKPFGCRAVARKPIPKRGTKITAQNVDAVYLGKARDHPGAVLWCPEYGIMHSTNVTYIEDSFPFKDGTMSYEPFDDVQPAATAGGAPARAPDPDYTDDNSDENSDSNSDSNGNPQSDHGEEQSDTSSVSADSPPSAPQPARRVTRSQGQKHDQTIFAFDALDKADPKITCALARGQFPPPWADITKMQKNDWVKELLAADDKETDGIFAKDGVIEVPIDEVPEGTKILNILTARKLKRDGKTIKARHVLNGKHMVQGEHYDRSYSPTLQHTSVRGLTAVAAIMNLIMSCGDFTQAYLHADGDRDIYSNPPKSARQRDEQGRRLVWLIKKALYGGKASGRFWYNLLRPWFLSHGFMQSGADPCIFVKYIDENPLIIGVYVDDLIILHRRQEDHDQLVAELKEDFDFEDLGRLTSIIGTEFLQSDHSIIITQTAEIEALADFHLTEDERGDRAHVPALAHLPGRVETASKMTKEEMQAVDPTLKKSYQSLVGSLLYKAMVCRPDIAYATGALSRVMDKPTVELMDDAKRVLRYLFGTKDMGIRYLKGDKSLLHGMSDASWSTGKSTSGYAFFLAGATLSYMSKLQGSIAMSSYESEIMAASAAALEAIFLRTLLSDLGVACATPTSIGIDNKAAVDMAQDYISNSRTRHIERRHLKIRELIEEAKVAVRQITTESNVSDIFTKPLGRRRFDQHRKTLLNSTA